VNSSGSSSFITLGKNSPEFDSYLRGTFSKVARALPVESLNINTDQERVTFQIVPVKEIQKPGFFKIWLKVLRPRSFLMVLFPMFLIAAKNISDNTIEDSWTMLLSTLGVLFLFAAFTLRNDYVDHMKGFDRIDSELGSRPIQAGWVTAESVRRLASLCLFVSVFLAFPVFIAFPPVILFVGIAAVISYLTLYRVQFTFKEFAGGELGILLLVGPLLTSGYELSIAGEVRPESLVIGFIWGWMALLPIHLRNLSLILGQSQAGLSNLVTHFGFDKGKKFIYYWWLVSLVGFIAYHYFFAGFFWFWFYSGIMLFVSLPFTNQLFRLDSPVGSRMLTLRKVGTYLLNFVMALWVIETLWYIFYEL
jgi:1,4-dihydroxy-2-naphthoate octaprenyltransferase